jgi:hypothetical protein
MAPKDPIRLPLRWEFLPTQNAADGAVRWKWRAYTQTGALTMQSEETFDTLTECMSDARERGYGER